MELRYELFVQAKTTFFANVAVGFNQLSRALYEIRFTQKYIYTISPQDRHIIIHAKKITPLPSKLSLDQEEHKRHV